MSGNLFRVCDSFGGGIRLGGAFSGGGSFGEVKTQEGALGPATDAPGPWGRGGQCCLEAWFHMQALESEFSAVHPDSTATA